MMQGLTWKSLKKNPSLMPLFFFVGAGSVMAMVYVYRLASRHPEVTWTRANKDRPWDAYQGKQYKLWNDSIDYKKFNNQAPKLD